MKILMLSSEDISALHGGAVHTLEVARSFVAEGHEVTLVSAGHKKEEEPFEHISRSMRRGPVASTWEAKGLEGQLRQRQFDVIYERQLIFGGLGAAWGKRWCCQVIFEVNSPHKQEIIHRYPWLTPFSWVLNYLEKKMFKEVTGVVTTHSDLVPSHYEGKVFVGPWAVRVNRESDQRPWECLENRRVILVAGSFQSWHGHSRLLPILNALENGPWALALAGGQGGVRERTAKELQDNLPFPVWDLGRLSQEKMHSAYRGAHVLLAPFELALPDHPFYYSPFKILEALACSLPVVTNHYDNLKMLMDEEWCGHTVDSFEADAWANALKTILKEDKVKEGNGRAYEKRHSWRSHVSHFLKELL